MGQLPLSCSPIGGGRGRVTLLLLFIFRVRSQFSCFCYFEFFNFRTLEKFCKFRLKKCKFFLYIKIIFVSL